MKFVVPWHPVLRGATVFTLRSKFSVISYYVSPRNVFTSNIIQIQLKLLLFHSAHTTVSFLAKGKKCMSYMIFFCKWLRLWASFLPFLPSENISCDSTLLWSVTNKNRDVSTGQPAHPFPRSHRSLARLFRPARFARGLTLSLMEKWIIDVSKWPGFVP